MSRDDMVIRPRLNPPAASSRVASGDGPGTGSSVLARFAVRTLTSGSSALRLGAAGAVGAAAPIAAGAATLALMLLRFGTGRSFENLGHRLKGTMLGDLPEETVAAQQARASITSRPDLMRAVAANGTDSVRAIYQEQYRQNLMRARGRERFMRDPSFETQSLVDLILLRFQEAGLKIWTGKDWIIPAARITREVDRENAGKAHRKGD